MWDIFDMPSGTVECKTLWVKTWEELNPDVVDLVVETGHSLLKHAQADKLFENGRNSQALFLWFEG